MTQIARFAAEPTKLVTESTSEIGGVMTSLSSRPADVQIRIDGDEWRYHGIERAQNLYGCDRSDAISYACEDISQLVSRIEEVLDRYGLTRQQRRELAAILSTYS